MKLSTISFFVFILTTSFSLKGQENYPNIFQDNNGQIYVRNGAPIYFFISPADKSSQKQLIPSTDSLANPMYFDGPGRHYLIYNNKGEKVRYLILSDDAGPKPKIKVNKGLLFERNNHLYIDTDAKISISAIDKLSGTKSIFVSINSNEFKSAQDSYTFNNEGESELKVFAIDNVGNVGDTVTYKIITSPNATFRIDNIYFETASAKLLSESYSNLDEMLQILKEYPELLVEISAYADTRGTSESNLLLSERRANSVTTYLISKGIDPKRLKAKGYGDSKPINECLKGVKCPDEKHRQNRRVEFKFSLPKK